jgi:hypothetical protein
MELTAAICAGWRAESTATLAPRNCAGLALGASLEPVSRSRAGAQALALQRGASAAFWELVGGLKTAISELTGVRVSRTDDNIPYHSFENL